MGKPVGEMTARGYHGGRQEAPAIYRAGLVLAELRGTYDAVICEGPAAAEINLRVTTS